MGLRGVQGTNQAWMPLDLSHQLRLFCNHDRKMDKFGLKFVSNVFLFLSPMARIQRKLSYMPCTVIIETLFLQSPLVSCSISAAREAIHFFFALFLHAFPCNDMPCKICAVFIRCCLCCQTFFFWGVRIFYALSSFQTTQLLKAIYIHYIYCICIYFLSFSFLLVAVQYLPCMSS